jgi:uncharacterized membrane protein
MTPPLAVPGRGRYRWTVFAFLAAAVIVAGLVVWQLYETTPARWCAIAVAGSPESTTGCYQLLMRLLELKDHAVLSLLAILGLLVLSLTAIALGVGIKASGPGGTSIDIGAEQTKVTSDDTTVTLPTPPAG